MSKKPDTSYINIGSKGVQRDKGREKLEPTMEISIPQTSIAIEILFREYGAGSHQGFKIHRPFFTNGEVTQEARELILEAFKKHSSVITITPELMDDLPNIIAGYMEKMGYDIMVVRSRILSLQREKQKR